MGPWNSRSTDKVDSIHMDNSHIRTDSCCSSHTGKPDNQIQLLRPQFPLKPERQNAAPEQKPIRLPSKRLRAVFSLQFTPFLVCCFARDEVPYEEFPDAK